jgi:hypothetical protein
MPDNVPKIRSDPTRRRPSAWNHPRPAIGVVSGNILDPRNARGGDQAPGRDDPPKVALAHISVTITTCMPQRSKGGKQQTRANRAPASAAKGYPGLSA